MAPVSTRVSSPELLTGKLLIAMPSIRDPNFANTVVFLCAHSEQGAMGLVINKAAPLMSLSDLIDQIDMDRPIAPEAEDTLRMPIRLGGPVEQYRGFVLHSRDYLAEEHTLPIGSAFGLTATIDVLKDIAHGSGPANRIVALGYSGWAPGQLENEIQHNGWLHCEADEALVFDDALETKHHTALRKLGVDPGMLSTEFGHA